MQRCQGDLLHLSTASNAGDQPFHTHPLTLPPTQYNRSEAFSCTSTTGWTIHTVCCTMHPPLLRFRSSVHSSWRAYHSRSQQSVLNNGTRRYLANTNQPVSSIPKEPVIDLKVTPSGADSKKGGSSRTSQNAQNQSTNSTRRKHSRSHIALGAAAGCTVCVASFLLADTAHGFVKTSDSKDALDHSATTSRIHLTDQLPTRYTLEQLAEYYAIQPGTLEDRPIELLFTDNDPDQHHQRLERLLRNTQQSIIDSLMDIESETLRHTPTHILHYIQSNAPSTSASAVTVDTTPDSTLEFGNDVVVRPDGSGGGVARIYQNGIVFQKAGVSTSFTKRNVSPQFIYSQAEHHSQLRELIDAGQAPKRPIPMFTASMSLVLHPRNPNVPTVHANYRYFELDVPDASSSNGTRKIWWYGGGSDLTPNVVNDEDATHFHSTLRDALSQSTHPSKNLYQRYKQWCDDYFFIRHRNERRGVGGIFFEDQHQQSSGMSKEQLFDMITGCTEKFNQSYFPLVMKHKDEGFTPENLQWQQLRRGRYVEFNLVYDRGTTYGLTHMPPAMARPDAVLMSLPLTCRFEYGSKPPANSDEERTIDILRNPREWVH